MSNSKLSNSEFKKYNIINLAVIKNTETSTTNFFWFEFKFPKNKIINKIKPDIVPIAKGIGGGFPVGAVLVNKKVASGMKPGTHGSTFGGNPLAMSVGNAVIDVLFRKGFLSNVKKNGKYFHGELNKCSFC